MIPRRFFWLFDLLTLIAAFFLAWMAAPAIQKFVLTSGFLQPSWIAVLSPPLAAYRFPGFSEYFSVLLSMIPTTLIMMEVLGGYAPIAKQSLRRICLNSLLSQLAGLGILSSTFFILRTPGYSRFFVFSFVAINIFGLSVYRAASLASYKNGLKSGAFSTNIAFIGPRNCLEQLCEEFAPALARKEFRLMGYFSVDPGQRPPNGVEISHLGDASDLGNVLVHEAIEYVIAVLPANGSDWIDQVIRACDYFRINLHIVPTALMGQQLNDLQFLHPHTSIVLPGILLTSPHLDSEALFLKRVLDVVISGICLVVLAPLFLIIAALIKLTTPNLPVFYRWCVVGYKGKRFTGYKFTTMIADADDRKHELAELNEMSGPVFKLKDDPRTTPLGRFLRKFSLNELPQLWSVFRGDMSLVGPRPAFPHELERYELWHKRKLSVRPGITCLWQVRGRNLISNFDDWVRMDLEYIANWSLGLDMSILARTVWVVLRGTGS